MNTKSTKNENNCFDINFLKDKWQAVQKLPNVFAYSLNVQKHKYLCGNLRFYAEYNPERTSLRRPPQTISSIIPEFDDEKFNFTKIHKGEHIQTITIKSIEVAFIINKSPLTKYHTLICPDVNGRHAQRLTYDSLNVALHIMMQLQESDKAFRIGYNSPGALASVNHLHLHLMYIEADLYIDHAILEPLFAASGVHRLPKTMPTAAVCWLFNKTDTEAVILKKLAQIYDAILWLCKNKRPHNLFITQDIAHEDVVKFFVFARENYCFIKDVNHCNIGFCELAGYVPVGNAELYEALSEDLLIERINSETGAVYEDFYKHILLYENE